MNNHAFSTHPASMRICAARAHCLRASHIAFGMIRAAWSAVAAGSHANDSHPQKSSHTAKGVALMAVFVRKAPVSWQRRLPCCPLRGGDSPASMHSNLLAPLLQSAPAERAQHAARSIMCVGRSRSSRRHRWQLTSSAAAATSAGNVRVGDAYAKGAVGVGRRRRPRRTPFVPCLVDDRHHPDLGTDIVVVALFLSLTHPKSMHRAVHPSLAF